MYTYALCLLLADPNVKGEGRAGVLADVDGRGRVGVFGGGG